MFALTSLLLMGQPVQPECKASLLASDTSARNVKPSKSSSCAMAAFDSSHNLSPQQYRLSQSISSAPFYLTPQTGMQQANSIDEATTKPTNSSGALRPATIAMVRSAVLQHQQQSILSLAGRRGKKPKKAGQLTKAVPITFPDSFGASTMRAVTLVGVVTKICQNISLSSIVANRNDVDSNVFHRLRLKELAHVGCPPKTKVISQRRAHLVTICDGSGIAEVVVPIYVYEDDEEDLPEDEEEDHSCKDAGAQHTEYERLERLLMLEGAEGDEVEEDPDAAFTRGRTPSGKPNGVDAEPIADSSGTSIKCSDYVHITAFATRELSQRPEFFASNVAYGQKSSSPQPVRLCCHSLRILECSSEAVLHQMATIAACYRILSAQ